MNTSVPFKQINIVPRWIIFLLDLSICFISLSLAYFIKHNLDVSTINMVEFSRNSLIIVTLSTVVFLAVKTHTGIIRYTSAQDSFRILLSVVIIHGSFLLMNIVSAALSKPIFISNSVLIISCLACFLFMVIYRVMIKYFFVYIKNLKLDKKRVIIYGAGEAGVAAKRTFDHDYKVNKRIIAFVDDDQRKVGKSIDGIKILDAANLPLLISEHELDEIIFAAYTIPEDVRNSIVDICLENNVKVRHIPSHDVWPSGKMQRGQIQKINIEDLLNRKPIHIDTAAIQAELKGKRILITGAAGSIGSEIVRQLLKMQAGLIIMCDQSETALHHLYLEIEAKHTETNFHAFIGDVKDVKRMQHLFETYKPHYVYHAAAYKHVPMMEDNAAEAIKTNVLGTKTIADLSVQYDVKKFVMISTDKAVNPTNVMGASKRIAEIYVQSLNNHLINNNTHPASTNGSSRLNGKSATRFITTRFGNVLGSNGSVIPRFKEQIEKGGPVTVTHPEITRYFMTIPEACRLVLEAGCMGKGGEIFIFDMGKSVKIVDLAKTMIRLAGLTPNQDIKIEYTGLRPGEKLFEELLNDNENTMPTHHEKIMIGKVREYKFTDVEKQIHDLVLQAQNNNNQKVVMLMKQMVSEFKSKNSIFEELDLAPNTTI
ncbi:nucleoside-diphosphate sugar epimerase/dehydratase [Mucilaginibacter sp. L3T2-6]|uniref:polysaccharide biosynthesis protein n=1 Tax=Mucilaginibacter sp. L3T2-6 TaxID=3062491 RepID=UPI002674FD55|nr:nucleoside-diphosphate sugar epimerase/dehydratase [Mucilaginibacter sp. L3T2-6]MDO3644048.1 nucleoside-diphosphate sugar epimerase/dehydratase [Mucilaginibacter sp. L3T2-6]MDV6216499.1 nucleoside-diphosphate sugar epimerase/dehydratase [Mucilaginibacter sp. L3T2-6]